jgi:hypothetical protein
VSVLARRLCALYALSAWRLARDSRRRATAQGHIAAPARASSCFVHEQPRGMAPPRDLLPPAARAALPSVAEVPATPSGGGGGAEEILAELETREGPIRYAAYASRTAQLTRLAERVRSERAAAACADPERRACAGG